MSLVRSTIAAAAALLFGLGATSPAADAQQPKHGGTLRFVMKYEPPTLSVLNNTSTTTTSPKIWDGLLTL